MASLERLRVSNCTSPEPVTVFAVAHTQYDLNTEPFYQVGTLFFNSISCPNLARKHCWSYRLRKDVSLFSVVTTDRQGVNNLSVYCTAKNCRHNQPLIP